MVLLPMAGHLSKRDLVILEWLYRADRPVYQNEISKLINIDSKTVTKSLYKLEKLGLIQRQPAVHNKKKTYIIEVNRDKVAEVLEKHNEHALSLRELFLKIAEIPCIACQHIYRCYEGGFYDPLYCQLLANYMFKLEKPRDTGHP